MPIATSILSSGSYFWTCQTVFGSKTFGKTSGLGLFVGGLAVLTLIPVRLAVGTSVPAISVVNLIMTALLLPLFHYPLFVARQSTLHVSPELHDVPSAHPFAPDTRESVDHAGQTVQESESIGTASLSSLQLRSRDRVVDATSSCSSEF